MMKKEVGLSVGIFLLLASRAEAANLAVITTPPTLINIVILIVAIVGLISCGRIMAVLKGGLLNQSWQWFALGFALMALAQIAMLLHSTEIFALPIWVAPGLLGLMSGIFLLAVLQTKRTLS